jgi:hypothetical protein
VINSFFRSNPKRKEISIKARSQRLLKKASAPAFLFPEKVQKKQPTLFAEAFTAFDTDQ